MTGINLAKSNLSFFEKYKDIKKCIFISYKRENRAEALNIGEYIMENNIDIYLDVFDDKLQVAANDDNHELITSCLEKGLSKSTHLLSIISEKTRDSWWVPYEIGYSKCKKSKTNVATILLKDFNDQDIPSYLRVARIIYGKYDFHRYLQEVLSDYPELYNKYSSHTQENEMYSDEKNLLGNILKEK
ncbi:toll/interleukin-1 receptor domain-containing protein [Guptibacillus spartinae]|uniref:toll/interleukin-1 receptor domain-containing protein n=1 Tax=Guptibacillus spartinae TaxID=3025679 RepID=UPI002360C35B|nr:toll/interleukin-1 receptor domain-containing protein [Pseudalkalibacillus spartinae]